MFVRLLLLMLDSILVGLFFVLGVIYRMGLANKRSRGMDDGQSILKAIMWLWFVLMGNQMILMYNDFSAIMDCQGTNLDIPMVLNVVARLLLLPMALLFLYATMKRNPFGRGQPYE